MTLDDSLFVVTDAESVAAFAREASAWRPDTYKTGKRKGQPCMRNQRKEVRDMTPEEKTKHRPDLLFDLAQADERRVLADLYEDRGHPGDDALAQAQRDAARRMDVHDAIAGAVRHVKLIKPVPQVNIHLQPRSNSNTLDENVPIAPLLAETRRRMPDMKDDEFVEQIGRAVARGKVHVVTPSAGWPSREWIRPEDAGFRGVVLGDNAHLDVGRGGDPSGGVGFSHLKMAAAAAHELIAARPGMTADDIARAVRAALPGVTHTQAMHVLAGNGVGGLNNFEGWSRPWIGTQGEDGAWRYHPRTTPAYGPHADRAE